MDSKGVVYINSGKRDYHLQPVPVCQRGNWEFQAILRGGCHLIRSHNVHYIEDALVIAPPDSRHGWSAGQGQRCEMFSIHFQQVPQLLADKLNDTQQGVIICPLNRTQKELSLQIYQRCFKAMYSHTELASLYFQKAVIDLSILVLKSIDEPRQALNQYYKNIANQAVGIFLNQMQYGGNVNSVAEQINISTVHLRRIFKQVYGTSVFTIFSQERLRFAREQLLNSDYSITEISDYCGFSSCSVFCRHFKARYQVTPLQFRRTATSQGLGKVTLQE